MSTILYDTLKAYLVQWDAHPFHQTMKREDMSFKAKMAFAPEWANITMGFKDFLDYASRPGSDDPVQQHVNDHAEEDADHFPWFFNDLKRLDLENDFLTQQSGPKCALRLMTGLYAPKSAISRELNYRRIERARNSTSARVRTVLVEIFESTYAIFAGHIAELVKREGRWEELEYFGRIHVEAEMGHSAGSWFEDNKGIEVEKDMSAEEIKESLEDINEMMELCMKLLEFLHQEQLHYDCMEKSKSVNALVVGDN
ncbi:aspartate carbamoyltransferase regulatory chain [Acrasis kona]|uniref:Aspartate carbamoyltransferase regulatory chain n=1 Tax=Acrasis kona TaxID=1008807 RepID=A0AAW2ZQB0_9EUKA